MMLRHSCFFDADYYRQSAGLPKNVDPAVHYLDIGWRDFDPSPHFSRELYFAANKDVKDADVNPLAEIREGNFRFDIQVTPTPPLRSASAYVAYTDAGFSAYFE